MRGLNLWGFGVEYGDKRILVFELSDLSEGRLTKARAVIVSEASLADAARCIDMGRFILLGKG